MLKTLTLVLVEGLSLVSTDAYLPVLHDLSNELVGASPWAVLGVVQLSMIIKLTLQGLVLYKLQMTEHQRLGVALGGFVVLAAASWTGSYSVHLYWLAISRAFQGASEPFTNLAVVGPLLCTPTELRSLPRLRAAIGPCFVIAAPVIGGIIASTGSWRHIMRCQSIWGVVNLLFVAATWWRSENNEPRQIPIRDRAEAWTRLRRGVVGYLGLCSFLTAGTVTFVYNFPFYLRGVYGMEAWAAGLALAVTPLSATCVHCGVTAAFGVPKKMKNFIRITSVLLLLNGVALYVMSCKGGFTYWWGLAVPGWVLSSATLYFSSQSEFFTAQDPHFVVVLQGAQHIAAVIFSTITISLGATAPERLGYALCNLTAMGLLWYYVTCGFSELPRLPRPPRTLLTPGDSYSSQSSATTTTGRILDWAHAQANLTPGTPPLAIDGLNA